MPGSRRASGDTRQSRKPSTRSRDARERVSHMEGSDGRASESSRAFGFAVSRHEEVVPCTSWWISVRGRTSSVTANEIHGAHSATSVSQAGPSRGTGLSQNGNVNRAEVGCPDLASELVAPDSVD